MLHFFPLQYEEILLKNIEIWKNKSENAFVIIDTLKIEKKQYSEIKHQSGEKLLKAKIIKSIGFLVEGDLPNEIQEQAQKLEGYRMLENEEFEEFYQKIKQENEKQIQFE